MVSLCSASASTDLRRRKARGNTAETSSRNIPHRLSRGSSQTKATGSSSGGFQLEKSWLFVKFLYSKQLLINIVAHCSKNFLTHSMDSSVNSISAEVNYSAGEEGWGVGDGNPREASRCQISSRCSRKKNSSAWAVAVGMVRLMS